MKKQILILMLAILFSLTFVSAYGVSYKPIDMPNTENWMEWVINKTTDTGFDINIADSRSKITEICLLSKTAKGTGSSDLINPKNVYDINGKQITSLSATSKTIYSTGTAETKYGYCYTTVLKDIYLKFGENTTIIDWVNQSGGNAYKGYNFCTGLGSCPGGGNRYQITQGYSSAEKNTVSIDDATVVTGIAGNYYLAEKDCSTLGGTYGTPCSNYSIGDCVNYITYTNTQATSCAWTTSCVTAQQCKSYGTHRFDFTVTKSGATNLNFTVKTTTATSGAPGQTTNMTYYLVNFTSSTWVLMGSQVCSLSTTVPCNYTFSTTNINDFISSSNNITLTVQTGNTNTLNARYVALNVTYCWDYSNNIFMVPTTCGITDIWTRIQDVILGIWR